MGVNLEIAINQNIDITRKKKMVQTRKDGITFRLTVNQCNSNLKKIEIQNFFQQVSQRGSFSVPISLRKSFLKIYSANDSKSVYLGKISNDVLQF